MAACLECRLSEATYNMTGSLIPCRVLIETLAYELRSLSYP